MYMKIDDNFSCAYWTEFDNNKKVVWKVSVGFKVALILWDLIENFQLKIYHSHVSVWIFDQLY